MENRAIKRIVTPRVPLLVALTLIAAYSSTNQANPLKYPWFKEEPKPPRPRSTRVFETERPAHYHGSRTVVGCENGTVFALDGGGSFIRKGVIEGKPTCIAECRMSPEETGILLGSDKGEVRLFEIGNRSGRVQGLDIPGGIL